MGRNEVKNLAANQGPELRRAGLSIKGSMEGRVEVRIGKLQREQSCEANVYVARGNSGRNSSSHKGREMSMCGSRA